VRIIHFADSHLGVENYGHIDPATGMNTRLLDTLSAFDQLVDYVLHNDIDLVLFSGDAYKNREPSQTQQRELAKRISRLSEAGVPVFILIGNHDLPNAMGRATSTEIFSTLGVKNIYVSTRPDVYSIPTRHGTVQVASLPWLRRSALLSREETRNLNFEQINERLQMALSAIVAEYAFDTLGACLGGGRHAGHGKNDDYRAGTHAPAFYDCQSCVRLCGAGTYPQGAGTQGKPAGSLFR
jgi:exonuclease SbcD